MVAVVVRLLAVFPLFRHPAEADVTLNGLCAARVLAGEWPSFFSGYRIGSLECYATALSTLIAGPGRLALQLSALGFNLLELALCLLCARQLFGSRGLRAALPFLVVPPLSVVFWTAVPNGYAALAMFVPAVIWAAARFAGTCRARDLFLFGLVSGASLWHSLLCLPVVGAAGLWMLESTGRRFFRPRLLACAVIGSLLGTSPWWLFNARNGWPTLTQNFATQRVERSTALRTLRQVVEHRIPQLVVSADLPHAPFARPFLPVVRWASLAALAGVAALFWARRRSSNDRRFGVLAGALVVGVVGANAISYAGSVPGMNERYVLPLAILVPLLAGWTGSILAGRSRVALVAFSSLWLCFQIAAFSWPWVDDRRAWRRQGQALDRAVVDLEAEGVDTVVGNYWASYPFAYFSGGRILPWTCEEGADSYELRGRAALRARRVAFVHFPSQPPAWRSEVLAQGAQERLGLRSW